jgi:hypothetical protein
LLIFSEKDDDFIDFEDFSSTTGAVGAGGCVSRIVRTFGVAGVRGRIRNVPALPVRNFEYFLTPRSSAEPGDHPKLALRTGEAISGYWARYGA